VEELSAEQAAARYGYTVSTVYSMTRDFKKLLQTTAPSLGFFVSLSPGRKPTEESNQAGRLIIELRKKYLSVPDIKAILDAQEIEISEKQIYNLLRREGFARLPRRSGAVRQETLAGIKLEAAQASLLDYEPEAFQTHNSAGLLCLLPIVRRFGLDSVIEQSLYPETKAIPKLNAILSFLALKLSNVRRYTSDDLWCMDRGLGLFAGLNVLPKAAWFTSYSHRVTRRMNRAFLKSLAAVWKKHALLADTANLDFTTVPYWGEDVHLENNWSGTRHKALASMLAALAHDPDTGIITYGDITRRHSDKDQTVLEFLDFYRESGMGPLQFLVFDSKFTTYENLARLDEEGIKFLTIRRRGKQIVEHVERVPATERKTIRVPAADGKTRVLHVLDEVVLLREYGKEVRQVAITGHGKIKPALIITNDFTLRVEQIVRKYARRWLVEKTISEQVEFFHLNKVSSSMVIKVDFDLTMTILAYNLYRLLAQELPGYTHLSPVTLFRNFIHNSADVRIEEKQILVNLKKKRNLPGLLSAMETFEPAPIPWLGGHALVFAGASRS